MADGDLLWDVRDLDHWIDTLKDGNGAIEDIIGRLR
jgi:hypothetical protein